MPVKTRAQRLKEDGGNGAAVTMSVPRKATRKARTSRRSTTSRKATNTNTNKAEIEGQSQEAASYKANVDEFRKYVKNILDSPNKTDLSLPRKRALHPGPSPRVERITIRDDDNQEMEFLIPPKQKDAAFEIRQRIRAVLSPDDKPQTVPFTVPQPEEKEEAAYLAAYPPVYNEGTHLWSPHPQMYDEQEAERISRWLIILIFSILTAVFFACYQEEIATFVKSQSTPIGQSINQGKESILWLLQNGWSSILEMILRVFDFDNGDVGDVVSQTGNVVDDTVTK